MGKEIIEAITKEASRIEEAAQYSSQNQFELAKIWRGANLFIGVPSIALAAIAGATGLITATGRYYAAFFSLIAAALSAVMTFLNLSRRIEQAHTSANAYLALQQDARVLREIDAKSLVTDELRARLSELTARQQEINKSAPIPSWLAYTRGRKNIKSGGQTYKVDK